MFSLTCGCDGLLGAGQLRHADAKQNYEDVSEHEGILNEDHEKS